jgi:hypothetical protein
MVPAGDYLDYSGRDDVLGGGARMVGVSTRPGVPGVVQARRQ